MVIYKKGINHVLPDYLSRLYEDPKTDEAVDVKEGEVLFSVANLEADELAPERTCQFIKKLLKDSANKKFVSEAKEKEDLIRDCHSQNHQGGLGMFQKLFQDGYWWEKMLEDCTSHAKACINCLRYNMGQVGFHPVKPLTATLPMDHVVWDLADIWRSANGFKFILILVDVATKFVMLRALKTKKAEDITSTLLEVISNFGFLKILQSDQDNALINEVMEKMRKEGGWELRKVMTYFPSQNGAVERVVGEVKKLLYKIWVHDDNWEKFIPAIQISLNDQVVSCHNSSPFALMFTQGLNQCRDYSSVDSKPCSFDDLLARNFKMVNAVYPAIKWKSKKSGDRYCRAKNKEKKTKGFKNNDFVMKLVDKRDNKEDPKWEGPFQVVRQEEGSRGFILRNKDGKNLKSAVAVSRLQKSSIGFVDQGDDIFNVKRILDHKGDGDERKYLIWWEGYPKSEATWESTNNIFNKLVIKEYWKKKTKSKSSSFSSRLPQ